MIEYIKGELDELTPATAVVEANGVGYCMSITLNTFSSIQDKKEVKLYVHESIREDAYQLWGFSTKRERELFQMLITVSGIGGNTARMILSSLTPSELCDVISTGNDKMLKSVKGIGLKTAQRIIVDLKDKIGTDLGTTQTPSVSAGGLQDTKMVQSEAVAALSALGFQASSSLKTVQELLKKDPLMTVEKVIKLALKQL